MIEQAYLEAADVTNPPVASLRARIGAAIDSSPAPGTGTVLDRVSFWLQLPTDTTVAGMLDKLCEARGKRVGTALSSAAAGGLYDPADLSAAVDITDKWAGIGERLHADRAVTVKGPTGHVGGPRSLFIQANGAGFHVIVLLATGNDGGPGGRPFFLAFDPDVSAVTEARQTWTTRRTIGDTVKKVSALSEADAIAHIKLMLLGNDPNRFGPLLRKYYVDTAAAFPAISRAGSGQ
ncbi:hypothetical protein [Streptomyces zhihengii]|uniref:Uncharacterized protein n=1 Tax=Streptomyces zhihengii TaxID=1818004 RepID=A0ABS2V6X4_9ACTN|nr:hypothetical protein [Streptomyces zhihengii]MBM9624732.1 hypothetical protein [Streptomyces zhihengii]